MKILITGATGFIGRHLILYLREQGHNIVALTRDSETAPVRLPVACPVFSWPDASQPPPGEAFAGVDAVIHLAGKNILGRWTAKVKQEIVRSRVESTLQLIAAMRDLPQKPAVMISMSGTGFYGDRGEEMLDESAAPGKGFFTELCQQWEQAGRGAEKLGIRTVQLRTGMVLGHDGGAMRAMLPPFRMGLGGRIGSGRQWMSWIHVRDLAGLMLHAIENESIAGPVNAVSPHPVTNADFTRTLGKVLKRPTVFPVPGLVLSLLLGEAGRVALDSQRVVCRKAIDAGYEFKFPDLQEALADVCEQEDHVLLMEQWVPRPVDEVFSFFSDAYNLEQITPPHLKFKVLGQSTEALQEGTLINYKLQLHGIPFRWQSLIHDWHPVTSFSDSQMRGPYKKWHHTHTFIEQDGGTLIRDHALYRIPFGVPGDAVAYPFVKKDLEKIFSYRYARVRELFGE